MNTFPWNRAESPDVAYTTPSASMHALARTVRWFVALVMDSFDERLAKLFTVSFRSSKDPGVDFLSSARQTGQNNKCNGEISGLLEGHGFTAKRLITFFPNLRGQPLTNSYRSMWSSSILLEPVFSSINTILDFLPNIILQHDQINFLIVTLKSNQ